MHPSAQKQSVKSQNMSYFSKALFWRQNILALISTQAIGGKIKHLLPTKLRVAPVGGEGGPKVQLKGPGLGQGVL